VANWSSFDGRHKLCPPIKMLRCQMANLHSFAVTRPCSHVAVKGGEGGCLWLVSEAKKLGLGMESPVTASRCKAWG
jgi:hypothetical protein